MRSLLLSITPGKPLGLSYEITTARAHDPERLPAIELAAATLLAGYLPDLLLTETTSVQEFREAQTQGRLWVVIAPDSPVGFAHVEFIGAHAVHLKEIDVHPAHGRRGLGARLVNTVWQWAVNRGYREMTLTTFSDVAWNMPFYARHGFEVIPAADLSAELASILKEEARRGLDPARRVAMRRRLQSYGGCSA
jgi:GNAT superfamily N-acetyltransferase